MPAASMPSACDLITSVENLDCADFYIGVFMMKPWAAFTREDMEPLKHSQNLRDYFDYEAVWPGYADHEDGCLSKAVFPPPTAASLLNTTTARTFQTSTRFLLIRSFPSGSDGAYKEVG